MPLALARALVRRPAPTLGAFALVAALAAPGLLRLETDNAPEIFFPRDAAAVADYRDLQTTFGQDDLLRVAIRGPALWSAEGVSWWTGLPARLRDVPGVGLVRGPGEPSESTGDPARWRESLRADPLARDLGLVDAAGATVTVVLALEPEAAEATLAAVRSRLAEAPPGLETDLVGLAVLQEAMDRSSREVVQRVFPLLVAIAAVLLAAALGSVRQTLAAFLYVGWVQVVLFGAMGYLGTSLNLVVAVLPPVLFVVALATATHLLVRYRDLAAETPDRAAAVVAALDEKAWAIVWTGATTFAGFGSLVTGAVAPVRTLGVASAAGIALLTAAAFLLLPALMVALPGSRRAPRPRRLERWLHGAGRALAAASIRRRRVVLAAFAALGVFAIAGLPRLAVESNALTYLPAADRLRTATEGLARAGVGAASIDLLVRLPPGESFLDPEPLAALTRLEERARAIPPVTGVLSAAGVLAEARRTVGAGGPFALVATDPEGLWALVASREQGERIASGLVGEEGRRARIALFVPIVGAAEIVPAIAAAKQAAAEAFPGAAIVATGELPLLLRTQTLLLRTLGTSLGLTLVVVALVFLLLLRERRLAALALVPNLWPVAGVLGAMAWSGTPLDVATVMVASVILGLAVDDTIHTLAHFRELRGSRPPAVAAAEALGITAPAYVLTGAVLICGFAVCTLSDFAPTARFGALAALGIALAVVADLTLVPALLGGPERDLRTTPQPPA